MEILQMFYQILLVSSVVCNKVQFQALNVNLCIFHRLFLLLAYFPYLYIMYVYDTAVCMLGLKMPNGQVYKEKYSHAFLRFVNA